MTSQQNFMESVQSIIFCTTEEAKKVFDVFCKLKILKLDTYFGKYRVSNGACWKRKVLWNAVNYVEK